MTLQSVGTKSNVVIFATGTITMKNTTTLNNAVVVGATGVTFQGDTAITAPLPYPAVIGGIGGVNGGNQNTTVVGTIFDGSGPVNLGPAAQVRGVVIGDGVKIQGTGSAKYTDGHLDDPNYQKYYAFMPGFKYPTALKTTVQITGNWQEVQ